MFDLLTPNMFVNEVLTARTVTVGVVVAVVVTLVPILGGAGRIMRSTCLPAGGARACASAWLSVVPLAEATAEVVPLPVCLVPSKLSMYSEVIPGCRKNSSDSGKLR